MLLCDKLQSFVTAHIVSLYHINLLWLNGTLWHYKTGLTWDQVKTCCLAAPKHYLNQYWVIICKVHFIYNMAQYWWMVATWILFRFIWSQFCWSLSNTAQKFPCEHIQACWDWNTHIWSFVSSDNTFVGYWLMPQIISQVFNSLYPGKFE